MYDSDVVGKDIVILLRRNRLLVSVIHSGIFIIKRLLNKKVAYPSWIKRRSLKKIAKQNNLVSFVETGTYLGDTSHLMLRNGMLVHTIEVDSTLAAESERRFKNTSVKTYRGDASEILKEVLEVVISPCLFWLDGHHSHGVTSQGSKESSLATELALIFNPKNQIKLKNSFVVIDDVMDLRDKDGYLSYEEIINLIQNYKLNFSIKNGMLIVGPF